MPANPFAAMLLLGAQQDVRAQRYPEKPIRVVVIFPPAVRPTS